MKVDPKFARKNIQKYMWDCGSASVAFLLRMKGYRVNYAKLMKDLGASAKRGTDLVRMVQFFKARPEFAPEPKNRWSLGEITKELGKDRVFLVAYQNWDRPKDIGKPDWGHYGVIYAIEGGMVRLFDPGSDTGLTNFSREEFEKRWYEDDLGVHYHRWAMGLSLAK